MLRLSNRLVAPALAVLVGSSFAPAILAQQGPETADAEAALREQLRQVRDQLIEARAAALQPITVNGEQISADTVKTAVVYLVGAKKVEAKISDLLTREYLEQAIEGGRPASDFEIPEEELTSSIATALEAFRKENPGVEFWEAVRALTGFSREEFLQQQRQSKQFERVFFPGAPQNWPDITREAIKAATAGSDGQKFWDSLIQQASDADGNPKELPPFWMQLCRRWVQSQLKTWSSIEYPSDGLDNGVVLSVNGRTWKTDEAYEFVRTNVYMQDMKRAMKEVVIREALEQELTSKGAYLSDEAFREEFAEFSKPYEGSPFNVEVIAVTFKGYPSLEAFRARWRLQRSFELMIEDEITDEALKTHLEKHSRFLGDGSVQVDVIPFLARDLSTGAWVPGGMDAAKERANAAMLQIQEGASFDEVLTAKGEFFQNDKERGRLGAKGYNPLRQALRENEFTDLLLGYSVGEYLFYDAPEAAVVGPLRGTDAYYLARINRRMPARARINIADEKKRDLVRQDYVNRRFLEWANGVMDSAQVQ